MKKKYKFIPDHFKPNLPKSIELGDVAGISIDQQDNIYLFNRSKHPVIVLSQTGELLRTWGQGVFKNPHGSHIGFDNNIYLTDNGDHTVRKFTLDGKLLLQIGIPDSSPGFMSGKPYTLYLKQHLKLKIPPYMENGQNIILNDKKMIEF